MVLTKKYKVKLDDLGNKNIVTNTALLSYLEDIGATHSESAGYGISQLPNTHLSWILLQWKLKRFADVSYGDEVLVKTWSRGAKKYYSYRDFEIYNQDGLLIACATSKWTLYNLETNRLEKITDELMQKYEPEFEKNVFEIDELPKLAIPENSELSLNYTIRKSDIDINKHMHNLYYLNLAVDSLPDDVFFESNSFSEVEIMYKKSAILNENVQCFYSYANETHIVTITTGNDLHAVVYLK